MTPATLAGAGSGTAAPGLGARLRARLAGRVWPIAAWLADGAAVTDELLDRTDTSAWPGQRWTSALARVTNVALVGENSGPPDAPHTGGDPASDTGAQQLQRAPDYARECGMAEFYWAFEDDLFTPGSGVDLDTYAERIAEASS